MNKIANLPKQQRSELFLETATFMNTTNSIVEKDFWVVWTLDKVFSDDRLNKILMFKGGTSLSKVFNLIGRFSEDIDLILDWRLVSKENPLNEQESKNKQVKFNDQIVENKISTWDRIFNIKKRYCNQIKAYHNDWIIKELDYKTDKFNTINDVKDFMLERSIIYQKAVSRKHEPKAYLKMIFFKYISESATDKFINRYFQLHKNIKEDR